MISKIHVIRGQKIMLDEDLAELYEVETKRLNEHVKRNKDRFPVDFMFQLSKEEFQNLKSHFATSSWGGRRIPPYFRWSTFKFNGIFAKICKVELARFLKFKQ